MEEVYREYRIAVRWVGDTWSARVSHVRGHELPLRVRATMEQGMEECLRKARIAIDDYIRYLGSGA